MKKTMFITSVIMVVVMAIALTTSSLAWFSAAGKDTVTTTALTVSAQATASTGIQIGRTATGAWFTNIELADTYETANDNIFGGMKPLMPLPAVVEGTDPVIAEARAALAANSFIGNVISGNEFAYTDGVADALHAITPYAEGFYVDDSIYITNMSSGSSAAAQYIIPDVKFKTSDGGTYTATSAHPDLFVAILADTNDADDIDTWEVVNVFHSNTQDATGKIDIARSEEAFASGQTVSEAYYSGLSMSDLRAVTANNATTGVWAGGTSTSLAAITGAAQFGVPKHFKVLAWYAGDALTNNNSSFGLQILLSFEAKPAYTGS